MNEREEASTLLFNKQVPINLITLCLTATLSFSNAFVIYVVSLSDFVLKAVGWVSALRRLTKGDEHDHT